MNRDPALTERLRSMLAKITALTNSGALHWEKQVRSSHRYAKWNDVLLILGPDVPPEDHETPRYLHITTLVETQWQEICSNDPDLGKSLIGLVNAVEASTTGQQPVDPFALTDEFLRQLTK